MSTPAPVPLSWAVAGAVAGAGLSGLGDGGAAALAGGCGAVATTSACAVASVSAVASEEGVPWSSSAGADGGDSPVSTGLWACAWGSGGGAVAAAFALGGVVRGCGAGFLRSAAGRAGAGDACATTGRGGGGAMLRVLKTGAAGVADGLLSQTMGIPCSTSQCSASTRRVNTSSGRRGITGAPAGVRRSPRPGLARAGQRRRARGCRWRRPSWDRTWPPSPTW